MTPATNAANQGAEGEIMGKKKKLFSKIQQQNLKQSLVSVETSVDYKYCEGVSARANRGRRAAAALSEKVLVAFVFSASL